MLLPGCYTQISTTGDNEREDRQTYASREGDENDTSAIQNQEDANNDYGGYRYDNYYDDNWHHHGQMGFSYYYPSYWPSIYFSAAYADPWYFGLGCDPYWFSSPYYYYPRAAYYSPWSGYYYSPYNTYGYYGSAGYPRSHVKSVVRTFGTQRSGSGERPASGGRELTSPDRGLSGYGYGNLPTGAVLHGGSAQPIRKPANVNTPR